MNFNFVDGVNYRIEVRGGRRPSGGGVSDVIWHESWNTKLYTPNPSLPQSPALSDPNHWIHPNFPEVFDSGHHVINVTEQGFSFRIPNGVTHLNAVSIGYNEYGALMHINGVPFNLNSQANINTRVHAGDIVTFYHEWYYDEIIEEEGLDEDCNEINVYLY
jgi:hypothetical protein